MKHSEDHLLKPPPRLSPLANFKVFAIIGAILGFLGADAVPTTLDLEPSLAPLAIGRVGSVKDGRPLLDNAFEGSVLKAVPFFS